MKLKEKRSLLEWCFLFSIVITIIILLISCENDDEIEIQKTSVNVNGIVESNAITGKNVQRGAIFGWISSITVKATQASYVSTTIFDLVANGTAGTPTLFTMDKVAFGSNIFTATTQTTVVPVTSMTTTAKATDVTTSSSGNNARAQVTSKFTAEKAKLQYAIYKESTPIVRTIASGFVDNISIPMMTTNSRIIVYVQNTDSNFTSFKVECFVGATRRLSNTGTGYNYSTNASDAWVGGTLIATSATILRTSNNGILFYLSNSTQVAGASVNFRITEMDSSNKTNYYWVDPIVMLASNTSTAFYHIQSSTMTTYKTY
jgi:hypothetical protein